MTGTGKVQIGPPHEWTCRVCILKTTHPSLQLSEEYKWMCQICHVNSLPSCRNQRANERSC